MCSCQVSAPGVGGLPDLRVRERRDRFGSTIRLEDEYRLLGREEDLVAVELGHLHGVERRAPREQPRTPSWAPGSSGTTIANRRGAPVLGWATVVIVTRAGLTDPRKE